MSAIRLCLRFGPHLNTVMFLGLVVVLSACAPRQAAQRAAPDPTATIHDIYVATERALDRTGPTFGEPRNSGLNLFRASISVPENHTPGHIEWPKGPSDAATDFVVTDTQVFDSDAKFINELRAKNLDNETLIFVHGYNNTLSDAMYRMAQMQADFNPDDTPLLYSWLSAGDPCGYVYDRDSVLYARDDLYDLIRQLTASSNDRVFLLAHSMGAQLVMEVMRQAALRGDRRTLLRINGVVLMSPDIDPDLFRRQTEAIGDLPDHFMIFVSQEDRALNLASLITGRKLRLGVIDGPSAVEGLGVQVIDFTALSNGEGLNHTVPVSSPAAVSVLKGMIAQAEAGQRAFHDYMVLTAQP